MDGDALCIFDCCMASAAATKCRSGLPRTYHMLAASAAIAPTCGPGENSFTTALCESLIELLKEAGEGTFLLTQLYERINSKRTSQACLSWDRLCHFKRTVELGRLGPSANTEDTSCNKDPEMSSLSLRLSFKSRDLKDGQIERLAEKLPHAFHEAKIPVRRIDWVRMTSSEREAPGIPSMQHDASFESIDGCVLDDVDNTMHETQEKDIYRGLRKVRTVQRFFIAIKREQANKNQQPDTTKVVAIHEVHRWAMAVKLSIMVFTIRLLYLRGDQTWLALWAVVLVGMLSFGPCKASVVRNCLR
jgi:hypothetical protein